MVHEAEYYHYRLAFPHHVGEASFHIGGIGQFDFEHLELLRVHHRFAALARGSVALGLDSGVVEHLPVGVFGPVEIELRRHCGIILRVIRVLRIEKRTAVDRLGEQIIAHDAPVGILDILRIDAALEGFDGGRIGMVGFHQLLLERGEIHGILRTLHVKLASEAGGRSRDGQLFHRVDGKIDVTVVETQTVDFGRLRCGRRDRKFAVAADFGGIEHHPPAGIVRLLEFHIFTLGAVDFAGNFKFSFAATGEQQCCGRCGRYIQKD